MIIYVVTEEHYDFEDNYTGMLKAFTDVDSANLYASELTEQHRLKRVKYDECCMCPIQFGSHDDGSGVSEEDLKLYNCFKYNNGGYCGNYDFIFYYNTHYRVSELELC